MNKLYQCPYEKAVKCNLKDCCLECETFGEYLNKNTRPVLNIDFVSGSALLTKAKQMRNEQQRLIDTYAERYNSTELGTLKGIDRIVKLIERHYR